MGRTSEDDGEDFDDGGHNHGRVREGVAVNGTGKRGTAGITISAASSEVDEARGGLTNKRRPCRLCPAPSLQSVKMRCQVDGLVSGP